MADNPVAESSDEALITETRQGDTHAYAELWKRHAHVGMVVARRVAPQADAEDLVTEAFTNILETMRNGRGPTAYFRPYLIVTIKHLAQRWEHHREDPVGSMDDLEAEYSEESDSELEYLRSAAASAFDALPAAWQDVLWYTEVVGLHPREVAPLLGMSANSVASLSFRAREGFKSAWIQAQVADGGSRSCQAIRARLGDYVRGRLSVRTAARVREHLDTCAECDELACDATETASHLAVSLAPFALGAGIGAGALTPSAGGQAVALGIPNAATAATVLASVGSRPFAEWAAPLVVPGLILAGVGGGIVANEIPPAASDSPVAAAPFEPDSPGWDDVATPAERTSPESPTADAPAPVAPDPTPRTSDAEVPPARSPGATLGDAGTHRAADAQPGTAAPHGSASAGPPPAPPAKLALQGPHGFPAALRSAVPAGLTSALPLDLPLPAAIPTADTSPGEHALGTIEVTVGPLAGVPAPCEVRASIPAD
jgi:RNA polymerase sigma factor (sigma-70 family)